MTIKHLMYTRKVPFLYTERACVLFFRFSDSPKNFFYVKRSVATISDQREYQGRHMTLERYHELFLAQVEVLDEVGITIEDDALVMEVGEQNGRVVPNDDDRIEARNQELTIRFIRGMNLQHKGYL